jgi:hypothetical protein
MVMLHGVKGPYGHAESLADVYPVSGNFMQKEVISRSLLTSSVSG